MKDAWQKMTTFLAETRAEMKKVTFPSRQEVVTTTVVVVITSFIFAFYLWLADIVIVRVYEGVYRILGLMTEQETRRKWYIVHTYSGFEERVRETLRQRAEALEMADAFGDIRIPTETIVEYKGGKKRETERKFFPGYILVEMEMSDRAWHVVKNTPKVTGFVGSGKKPTPLTQEEVDQILEQVVTAKEKPKPKYIFEKGELVKIIDGPFNNFTGVVEEVNLDRNTLKVMVTIFGRQTPVELDFSQVQKH